MHSVPRCWDSWQDFVFEQTGLASRLQTFVPEHPKLVFFPGDDEPAWIYRDPAELDRELASKWGERGQVEAFRAGRGEGRRVPAKGLCRCPSANGRRCTTATLGDTLTRLWITGSARALIDHYFTSERGKMYMAMTVTESGPVSLDDPYSAFTLPLMDSGSIFGGYYGFVKGGIWQITEELGRINAEIGIKTHLSTSVEEVDTDRNLVTIASADSRTEIHYDSLVFGTDPLTATKLLGNADQLGAY